MSGETPSLYFTLTLIAMQGHQGRRLKTMSLGTAHFFYVGSRVGWVSALQEEVLTARWRGQNESTIHYVHGI